MKKTFSSAPPESPPFPVFSGRGKGLRVFCLCLVLCFVFGTSTGFGQRRLLLLFTNDVHSHLVPFDLPEYGKSIGGAARRFSHVTAVRARHPATLFLDAGDAFQGTAFYSFFKGEADVKSFLLLGVDATTLGNHDLDDGLDNLRQQLRLELPGSGVVSATSRVQVPANAPQADFSPRRLPLLCCNVASGGVSLFAGHQIFRRGEITIGVIGGIGSEAWSVIPLKNRIGLDYLDMETMVASHARHLRPLVDVLILLSHAGHERDLELALRNPNLDVIVGGHTNTYLESPLLVKHAPAPAGNRSRNRLGGTLVVQAFKWGVFVGELDLWLDETRSIASYAGRLVKMDERIPVPIGCDMTQLVNAYEERISRQTSLVIGESEQAMTYPEQEKHVRDLPLGTFVAEALREFCRADLAMFNSGTVRDALPAGRITMGHLFQCLPFENTLVVVTMKGRDIQEMLNFVAERYGTITGYQFGGASFTLRLAERRAEQIFIGNAPLDPDKIYSLATISYLADGNQHGHILFKNAQKITDSGFAVRDVLLEYFRQHRIVRAPEPGRMRIIP